MTGGVLKRCATQTGCIRELNLNAMHVGR